jgi:uncharacterized phage protein gp47/JayE
MGSTPVCQITAVGCVRPTFADCLSYVQASYRAIYGQDMVLDASSQDGQFMALLANGIHDANGETLAAYNAYSPSTAQGVGLSSVVKINGIRRKSPTYSTCDFLNVGQAFTAITGGVITDAAGYRWALPDFVIPASGQILVSGTCQTLGAIGLSANAVDTASGKGSIATIQRGWQAVTNPNAAAPGAPVESDSALRQRQALSVALPSQTLLEGLQGAIFAVSGVTRMRAYENDGNGLDANGLPGHAISLVVEGGDATAIATLIQRKKGAAGTYGSTVVPITDSVGITRNVAFYRPTLVPVAYSLVVKPGSGYTQAVEGQIKQAIADWTTALGIGNSVELSAAYVPANLTGQATASTFEIVPNSLTAARPGSPLVAADVPIAFNEAAVGTFANVTITYPS